MFGSQPNLVERKHSCLGSRASVDAAYLNVPSTSSVSVTVMNPVTPRSPAVVGIPVTTGTTSATTYYNIPKIPPRIARSAGSSQGLDSRPRNVSNNPPLPSRHKTSPSRRGFPPEVPHSPKNSPPHSYYMFPEPTATVEINHVPAGPSPRPRTMPRSKSLHNVGSTSPSRKEKSPTGNSNNNAGNSNGISRMWRRYSVGDLLNKLQTFVSGGLSLPRGLVRTVSKLSMTHSSDTPSSPTKLSPDPSTSDSKFVIPGLKQRSASEIFRMSPQPEEVIAQNSPEPEKEVPPVPPPRMIVRPKPAAKKKVL